MTSFNLSGYPTDQERLPWDRCRSFELPHALVAFVARTGQWKDTAAGRVVIEQLVPALGGGQTDRDWRPASQTVDIDLTGLNRKELSSLARVLDDFARSRHDTWPVKAFVDAIVAEDAAAQTDPHAPRLFDM